ncbi:hypothetical protein [Tenacibaculum jejuense]|uniref:Uncharacterized protein n=1 Tax=Tenacibaculum jejuense TaxID=584609 RepID=A0A238U9Y6_9FLAO|nr:hypothetical protein [Tenacibaculum jejuense]SNR15895.1 conserved protein of unknown function [Tenacibaculum jejuense]
MKKIGNSISFKTILRYLAELLIVAFGVFLGVYYSNINNDNKALKEKEKSISLIISELEINKELLEEQIAYHKIIKTEIDSIIPSLTEAKMNLEFTPYALKDLEIKGWKGFLYGRLQKTAYESTKTSGVIKEFDIELIQKLTDTYNFQETYLELGTSILDKAISINSSMKLMDFLATIKLMTSDLLGTEKSLLKKLEKNISELKTIKS